MTKLESTNDERSPNVQMTKTATSELRHSDFVIPSSLDIRHSSFLMARADQFATIHPPAACTETGRANDWNGPAKIPFYPA